VIRKAWELSDVANPPDLATSAYDEAIDRQHGKGFSPEFVRFAAATSEWRSGAGGWPDGRLYPDVRRKGSLKIGSRTEFQLDHTAYRLIDVRPAGTLRLKVDADDGVRSGLGLVAREGDETGGEVKRKAKYLSSGGKGHVTLRHAKHYERITAVVVNADGRVKGFAGDWVYGKDNRRFKVKLTG
jgi:hypothetical protein